jgi:protein ImuB
VLARFGVEGRRFHALASGLDGGPPVLVSPPPNLVEQVEFDPPATRVDVAAFAAKGLADRLLPRLAGRGLACTRVLIEAETEHGERWSRCWRHDGALTPAALAERMRWQLDGWLAAAGTVRERTLDGDVRAAQDADTYAAAGLDGTTGALTLLRLVPDEVVPADGRQLGFWGGDHAARDRADRALVRVQGMLGYDAVVTAVVQGGRMPAEQVRWVPWGEPREPQRPFVVAGEVVAWPGAIPGPAPARVFDPPLPVELLDAGGQPVRVSGRGEQSAPPARLRGGPFAGGEVRVRAWAGPWAHDVQWWDPWARRRRALWHVVGSVCSSGPSESSGSGAADVAYLVSVQDGRAAIEAIYD